MAKSNISSRKSKPKKVLRFARIPVYIARLRDSAGEQAEGESGNKEGTFDLYKKNPIVRDGRHLTTSIISAYPRWSYPNGTNACNKTQDTKYTEGNLR